MFLTKTITEFNMNRHCKHCEKLLIRTQSKYCSKHCQSDYRRFRDYPNLIRNYFQTIDTKPKAYWLGFLYADGYVRPNERGMSIILSAVDDDQIDRFCAEVQMNTNLKKYYGPYGNTKKQVHLSIYDFEFTEHLVSQGCGHKKTFEIAFPALKSKELEKAFLLGYFDGDGTANSTLLTSGCLPFLKEIQCRFSITSDLKFSNSGRCGELQLGSEFFIDLLDNYRDSMPRKRRTHANGFQYNKEMIKTSENSCKDCQVPITEDALRCAPCNRIHFKNRPDQRKFDPTPEELKKLVWEMPSTKVGDHFGVSGRCIKKRCRKYGIETPGRGYWQKKRAGKL